MAVMPQSYRESVQTPHDYPFIAEQKLLTYERLEKTRLKKLGMDNRYSRHCSMIRQKLDRERTIVPFEMNCSGKPSDVQTKTKRDADRHKNNSLAPFATVGKPTCGYFFTTGTDNKKVKFGIPPSDLVKWRNFPVQSN